ncbi:MAG: hypothetical protein RL398_926 [Planctomycetota bacterium]
MIASQLAVGPTLDAAATPVGDVVTAVVWWGLAVACAALLRAGARGLWWVVAAGVVTIAVDKLVDLQTRLYQLAKVVRNALDGPIDLHSHREGLKAAALVSVLVAVVIAALWLARRDRDIDRGKLLALGGLLVVGGLVTLRLVPGLGWLADERVSWAFEAVAVALLVAGLAAARRRLRRAD